jgi:hypothetical protein
MWESIGKQIASDSPSEVYEKSECFLKSYRRLIEFGEPSDFS